MAILDEEYLKKFKRCVNEHTLNEYISMGEDSLEEDDPNAGQEDPAMGGAPADPSMGGAPAGPDAAPADGGAPADPSADPNAMGGAPAPGAEGGAPAPEGFAPQGVDPAMGDPNATGGAPAPGDEVIDVDELVDNQEDIEKKVDGLSDGWRKAIEIMTNAAQELSAKNDEKFSQLEKNLMAKIEMANPTPEQKLSMISTKSAPYGQSPQQAMDACAPANYSTEDDNNGEGDPQYRIMKSDIDNFTDFDSIAKSFEDERERMGLKGILGF